LGTLDIVLTEKQRFLAQASTLGNKQYFQSLPNVCIRRSLAGGVAYYINERFGWVLHPNPGYERI